MRPETPRMGSLQISRISIIENSLDIALRLMGQFPPESPLETQKKIHWACALKLLC